MDLIALRHTRVNIPAGLCYGQSDVPLAESFADEAQAVLTRLKLPAEAKVYTSPLSRCMNLAQKLHSCPIAAPELMELNFGAWEGQLWDNIAYADSKVWMDDFVHQRTPNGESLMEMSLRVKQFIDFCQSKNRPNVVWVTHAGVIRILHHWYKNVPLSEIFNIEINYGEHHIFRF